MYYNNTTHNVLENGLNLILADKIKSSILQVQIVQRLIFTFGYNLNQTFLITIYVCNIKY